MNNAGRRYFNKVICTSLYQWPQTSVLCHCHSDCLIFVEDLVWWPFAYIWASAHTKPLSETHPRHSHPLCFGAKGARCIAQAGSWKFSSAPSRSSEKWMSGGEDEVKWVTWGVVLNYGCKAWPWCITWKKKTVLITLWGTIEVKNSVNHSAVSWSISCIFLLRLFSGCKPIGEELELLYEVPCTTSPLSSPQIGITYILLSSCRWTLWCLPLENLLSVIIWVKQQCFKAKIKHKDIFSPVTYYSTLYLLSCILTR